MGDAAMTDGGSVPGSQLGGKVAIVTGGGGGIGAAISTLFAAHGAHVVIVERDPERAATTSKAIHDAGGSASTLVLDVLEPRTADEVHAAVMRDCGRIDVLVNNVGHYLPRSGEFARSVEADWDGLYQVNVLHVLRMTRAVLPTMIAQEHGSIVNVSSVEGMRGYPPDPVYGAAKAAVIQFTKSLALQVGARGVRVNGIAPDVTETLQVPYSRWVPPEQQHLWPTWVPVGRKGTPLDQANAALFLASEQSAFITGLTIPVDGGTAAAGGWFRTTAGDWTNRPTDGSTGAATDSKPRE
jgi:NAD(P)-dependent dehydrogenase (short-subunit alcohol dehydrogenase family)